MSIKKLCSVFTASKLGDGGLGNAVLLYLLLVSLQLGSQMGMLPEERVVFTFHQPWASTVIVYL